MHYSDCSIYNEPAKTARTCNCGYARVAGRFFPSLYRYACIRAVWMERYLALFLSRAFRLLEINANRASHSSGTPVEGDSLDQSPRKREAQRPEC